MGGERLLCTFPAAYVPFAKHPFWLFSSLMEREPEATRTLPSQVWPMSWHKRNLKMCQQNVESRNLSAVCSSEPSNKPVLNWAEGAGAWNFWNKTITSPLLPKCILLRGGTGAVCLFSSSEIYIQISLRLLEVENQISFLIDFFSRWKCSFNCFLVFDLSISFG